MIQRFFFFKNSICFFWAFSCYWNGYLNDLWALAVRWFHDCLRSIKCSISLFWHPLESLPNHSGICLPGKWKESNNNTHSVFDCAQIQSDDKLTYFLKFANSEGIAHARSVFCFISNPFYRFVPLVSLFFLVQSKTCMLWARKKW